MVALALSLAGTTAGAQSVVGRAQHRGRGKPLKRSTDSTQDPLDRDGEFGSWRRLDRGGRWAILQERPKTTPPEPSHPGLTAVDAWDGKEGWSVQPFEGRKQPFRQAADDAKSMMEGADIDGPLVDWREKGHKVEYLGTEDLDGTMAHKLRVALKDGNVGYDFLDPDTFLEIRTSEETFVRGASRIGEVDYGDYRLVAGTWYPFSVESGAKGEPRGSRMVIVKVEVNVDVDDSLFKFPAAGAVVARSVGGPQAAP